MITSRHVSILTLCATGAILITQFQNCAPAGPSSVAGGASADGSVRLVDDYNKVELAFATRGVQLHDEVARATVSGLCTRQHDGARLKWAIADRQDQRPLLVGEGSCAGGQFKLELAEIDEMVCGVSHHLIVEGDWGGSAVTDFVRRCQPLMSEPVASEGAPAGTSCELEYQPTNVGGEASCQRVCYRESQVINSVAVDANRCSPMASRLAGP